MESRKKIVIDSAGRLFVTPYECEFNPIETTNLAAFVLMKLMISEIHHVRGRLRARMPELKRNDEKARALKKAIASERGIGSVEVNVLTGSVLVFYEPELLNADAVLAIIGERRAPAQVGRPALRRTQVADPMLWWAVEKVVERSIPLVIRALL